MRSFCAIDCHLDLSSQMFYGVQGFSWAIEGHYHETEATSALSCLYVYVRLHSRAGFRQRSVWIWLHLSLLEFWPAPAFQHSTSSSTFNPFAKIISQSLPYTFFQDWLQSSHFNIKRIDGVFLRWLIFPAGSHISVRNVWRALGY